MRYVTVPDAHSSPRVLYKSQNFHVCEGRRGRMPGPTAEPGGPDEFERPIREITGDISGPGAIREPSPAQRTPKAARKSGWRKARNARESREPGPPPPGPPSSMAPSGASPARVLA